MGTGPFLMGTPLIRHRMRMERLLESMTLVLIMLSKGFHCDKSKDFESRGKLYFISPLRLLVDTFVAR